MRTSRYMPVALLLAAALIGGSAIHAEPTADALVAIDNFSFSKPTISVAAGTKVTWTNRDDIPHTVTDADEPRTFKSAALDTDEVFSHLFSTPGTYHYFCSLHPQMRGTVVVQ